jgi:N-acetylneuraminate synthase
MSLMSTEMRTRVIAEAGVNHNGDISRALTLVDVAAEAGADAVKFQTFAAARLVNRQAPKAQYQTRATGSEESQFDMLRRLELSPGGHEQLMERARDRGIEFLSTPFDEESLALLVGRFGLRTIKIASGEIGNAPFLLSIARVAPRVILSSGMSTLADIEAALGVLAFGFTAQASEVPGRAAFARAFASDAGQTALRERVTVLHCTTEYPAPFAEVNLRAMATIRSAFGLPVGYSDHTLGIHASLAAVALGATVIEKHFTLDRALPGPDHAASLEPPELRELVRQAREIEAALGDGVKRPTASEWSNRSVARRSLTASRPIPAGQVLQEGDLACKRPGTGMSPFSYWDVLGRPARRAYDPDDLLDE